MNKITPAGSVIFVTGTDTDVGKTIVSAGLCLVWPAYYWKPVQAGRQPCTDSDVIARFIPPSHIYPSAYVLNKAVSPNQAARVENIQLKKQNMIFSHFQKTHNLHSRDMDARNRGEVSSPGSGATKISLPIRRPLESKLVIEGAGGTLVPFNDQGENMSDLMKAEGAPVIITARSGLGTLNHTFLTLSALRAKNISILGVILVGPSHPDNKRDIERIGKVSVLLELPILKKISVDNLKFHFNKLKSVLP